jgi:hypothetical protein
MVGLFFVFKRTSTSFYLKPHYVPPHIAFVINRFNVAASSLSLISDFVWGFPEDTVFSYLLLVFPTSHFLTVDAMFLLFPYKLGSKWRWHYSNSIKASLSQSVPRHLRHFFQAVGVAVWEFCEAVIKWKYKYTKAHTKKVHICPSKDPSGVTKHSRNFCLSEIVKERTGGGGRN